MKAKAPPGLELRVRSEDAALRNFMGIDKSPQPQPLWGSSISQYVPLQQFTTCYSVSDLTT